MRHLALLLPLLAAAPAIAQQPFPPDATVPPAAAVQQHLTDRNFEAKVANGNVWRLDYKSNGYFYITVGAYTDSGKWKTEDGRLCHAPQKSNGGCNDVRLSGGTLFMQRDNGEVIRLVPR
ncbi:hypothetical protein H8N03_00360 [Ramlibacter sp. USB13]|uniref:Uncharacterized protein n=1 Tax=Ramlibacter cellulosilyticus TaxID=2764187 RepID=A0A923MPB4_9BURK|nr:hypothetical protein [Ramlibacter cellulosilyticus]MBC5781372.1 hypothetical protein [Ramlibacter cellulosilyticus]